MKKRNKIIYWIATIWLSLGMLSTAIVQIIKMEEEVENMTTLGYPTYLLPILGAWKILGVLAILIPKFPVLKEWTYAGFFFVMSGAIISHVTVGDELITLFGPTLLLILTGISWYYRPANRKLEKQ
ncbi:DoxX family protein [uncultured Marixanthomonas sp.]|uniref:DoxX family protein n=1 Tax=uncultured Marixanthomonas sp. TaxID=757245 RepID=UPI0030D89CD9|tara:strand:+ start:243 stop:620 length:378 start_codon:yes stop_codon:yes gene_type:complete